MGHGHAGHDHEAMIADFQRRFWVSLVLTVPVLALSPAIQSMLGLQQVLAFPGHSYVLLALSAVVFFYGGWPFLTGLVDEVSSRRPGMMTLIGIAITVAFVYSCAVVLGLAGEVFFWELVTLIDEALRQFFVQGLDKTEHRTGVLIFASAAERYAEIVADADINDRVVPQVWDKAVADLTSAIKAGRPAEGFVTAIEQCGAVLATHFPPGALQRNELPDKLVEI
jgi:uncharacterized membrane protein